MYDDFRQLIEVSKWSNYAKMVFFDFRLGRDVWVLVDLDTNDTYELVWKNGKILEGPIDWDELEKFAAITHMDNLSYYIAQYVLDNADYINKNVSKREFSNG